MRAIMTHVQPPKPLPPPAVPDPALMLAHIQAADGTRLYQFVRAGASGRWELCSSTAAPRFYDANEDAGGTAGADWHLEIDASDIDARADAGLGYVADPGARRVTFAAGGGLWALRFPSPDTYTAFMTALEVRCG